jgi:hypothetical protein
MGGKVFSVVAVCTLLAASAALRAQAADPTRLPGADGPRVEFVGTPPHEFEIRDAFVYALPDQAASHLERPNRFASGTAKLTLDLRVKDLPRLGTTIRYEVLDNEGAVELEDGYFSFARLRGEGVASLDFDLRPRRGSFKDGPHQLKLFMNGILVVVLNWTIGA